MTSTLKYEPRGVFHENLSRVQQTGLSCIFLGYTKNSRWEVILLAMTSFWYKLEFEYEGRFRGVSIPRIYEQVRSLQFPQVTFYTSKP
jgi:hypothetical protein